MVNAEVNTPTDPVHLINEWLQQRLHQGATSPTSINDLHSRFVDSAIAPLKTLLNADSDSKLIITVRSSFCRSKSYIRPVYTEPTELATYFRDPQKQRPFTLHKSGFFEGNSALWPIHANTDLRHGEVFGAFYKLDSAASLLERASFNDRIQQFRSDMAGDRTTAGAELRSRAESATLCFLAGRTREPDGSSDTANESIQVAHFLAIYSSSKDSTVERTSHNIEELTRYASTLFRGLDLIARIDATLFESEGLDLVAKLLPEFARKDVANADKLAYALERLRVLFARHMIGRHGGGEFDATSASAQDPSLFFVTTTFEKVQSVVTPRLYLYPHAYRQKREHHNVATFVAHRSIATATKFLMLRYLKARSSQIVATTSGSLHVHKPAEEELVKVADEFENLFKDMYKDESWRDAISPDPDFLLLTKMDCEGVIWDKLQRSAGDNARSIAAFIVEGKRVDGEVSDQSPKERLYLPRGIFALESPYEDGFSDDDIKSLRTIFKGLASLVRMISHHHSPIDYRVAIASTFERDIPPSLAATRTIEQAIAKYLFFTQKLDGDILKQILHSQTFISDRFLIDDHIKSLLAKMVEFWPEGGNEPTPDTRAKVLTARMELVQKQLVEAKRTASLEKLLNKRVLEFLEACPENFTWSSYLTCMAQTLGDRMGPGMMPVFSRMTPGFSASGMFIASIQGQLRQVVKLSSAEKVDEESDRYRKWVRYRLVNAARISSGAFEFETTGRHGKECGETGNSRIEVTFETVKRVADGILVSDLVSGESRSNKDVRTLLDTTASCMGPDSPDSELPSIDILREKVRAVFIDNAVLWNDRSAMKEEEKRSLNQTSAIEGAFRVGDESSKERKEIEDALGRVIELCTASRLTKTKYTELVDAACAVRLEKSELEQTIRIVHGDMNARNLTWSEALKSFFLIDFEHTGPGIQGADQMRLVVNLIAETWVAFECFHTPASRERHFPTFLKEIDNAIRYLKRVFMELAQPDGSQGLSGILSAFEPSQGNLEALLRTILETIDDGNGWYGPEWRAHWALMLFTAAAKEFTYTCRNVDVQITRRAMDGDAITDDDLLNELEKRAVVTTRDEANRNNIRHALLRNVLSGRLLGKLILALNDCCE